MRRHWLLIPCLLASASFAQIIRPGGLVRDNYPAYDPTTTQTVKWGPEVSANGAWVAGGLNWAVQLDPCCLQPGTYTLTTWKARTFWTTSTDLYEYRLVLYSKTGATYNLEWSKDVTASIAAVDGSTVQNLTNIGESITIANGKTYFIGVAVRTKTESKPGICRLSAGQGPAVSVFWNLIPSGTFADRCTTLTNPAASNVEVLIAQWTFTTTARKVGSVATAYSGTAKDIPLPKITSADYIIALKDVVVEDGEALTVKLIDQAGGNEYIIQTLVLDMGATDQVTLGAVNVALNAVTSESGDTFDIWINLRPATDQVDVLWQNKTTGQGAQSTGGEAGKVFQDIRAISHNAARAGGGRQTTALANTVEPSFLAISGTATIGSIEVCWEPLVIIGDSQTATKDTEAGPLEDRLLAVSLPTAFTHDRSHWNAGISGGQLAYDAAGYVTAAYKRYKADTPGQGDLCEATGVLIVIVMGVNDIAQNVKLESGFGAPAAKLSRNTTVVEMTKRLSAMVDDMLDRGNNVILIGLPPYVAAPEIHRAEAIQQWNHAIHGIALGARCAFYSPYSMVSTSPSTYLYTDNLHYSAAGAEAVAAAAARAYEAGTINSLLRQ